MAAWQIWLIIAGICFIIEIATIGFLVFWFAIAALITCILSLFISNVVVQMAIFVILSVILIFLTRPLAEKIGRKDSVITNSNAVVGKEGIVTKEIDCDSVGQIKVNSDTWSAISNTQEKIPINTKVKILKIDGVKLVVEPINN